MTVQAYPPATIEALDLPVRPYNILRREGVTTVAALCAMTEDALLEFRNCAPRDVEAIKEHLERYGMKLSPVAPQPFTSEIQVEHVTVYRWGGLQLTVNGDGSGVLSQRELSPEALQALCVMCAQITEKGVADGDSA